MKTSKDKIFWERDAAYKYYRHGPLARTILGQQQVQGVDYARHGAQAYTLEGWLKGVNSTAITSGYDMGGDGTVGTNIFYQRCLPLKRAFWLILFRKMCVIKCVFLRKIKCKKLWKHI